MMSGGEEEEVLVEIEAVESVYGDDCHVIHQQDSPPHLTVHLKPRTADVSSQQFVEATLGIKLSPQYPREPPYIYIIEMKGLDDNRQSHLLSSITKKAKELASCPMLVTLCEEAVEVLSNMNHPEGNCPLCLYPLVVEDKSGTSVPFMKLMSCFHCFHSECMIRWWKWLQEQNQTKEVNQTDQPVVSAGNKSSGMHASVNEQRGNCPVCREFFGAKDMEHVLDYAGTCSSQLSLDIDDDEKVILQSESENYRREKIAALLKVQQEKSGLIEPKKALAIFPGMVLPETITPSTLTETNSEKCENPSVEANTNSSKATTSKHKNSRTGRQNRIHSSNRPQNAPPRIHSSTRPQNAPPRIHSSNRPQNAPPKIHSSNRPQNAPTSRKQWIKKELVTSEQ